MGVTAPASVDAVCEIPTRVCHLGEALGPVARDLRRSLALRVKNSGREFVTIDDLSRHIGIIHQALTHLSAKLEDLMANVVHDERAGMVEAYRAAGRLEQVLSEFVDGYRDAKGSHGSPESGAARKLLLGVYRHHIREISEWLDDLVNAIAQPASALEKRKIAMTAETRLPVVLNVTRPPQMAQLHALAARLLVPPEYVAERLPIHEPSEPRGPGIFGTIGALAFGFALSNSVFGRRHG